MATTVAAVVPSANQSENPMAWTAAENALREVGQDEAADVCHHVAGELARTLNELDDAVVVVTKTP